MDVTCPNTATVLWNQDHIMSFLLPDSCQDSATPTRRELGKNKYWAWPEGVRSTSIIHVHLDKSARKKTKDAAKSSRVKGIEICFPFMSRMRNYGSSFFFQHILSGTQKRLSLSSLIITSKCLSKKLLIKIG